MEKLLAKKGIEFLSYTDEEGSQISYAFTNNMLKQGIIVVLSEWQYDPEEEDEESEELEETVDISADEQDWEEEDGDAAPEALFETTVSVISTKGGISHEFGIYADDRAIVPPIYLYRVILDLVEIITGNDADSLPEVLESVSTTVSSSEDYADDPETRNQMNIMIKDHLEKAAGLLAER